MNIQSLFLDEMCEKEWKWQKACIEISEIGLEHAKIKLFSS